MGKMLRLSCLFLALTLAFSCYAQTEAQDKRLITVTGDAEVKVVPDEVIITLGIETDSKDLNAAKTENDEKIKKIINAAKNLKIEDKYIQTDYMNIAPRYKDYWQKDEFIGYFVRKNISITLKDVSKFEQLLSNVLEAGANYVHGIDFRTTELRKHRDEARALAIKAAKEKADALAKQLGQVVGKPYKIQEGQLGWWSGNYGWWGARGGAQMAQNAIQEAGGPPEMGSSIALGQISIRAQITVSFELE